MARPSICPTQTSYLLSGVLRPPGSRMRATRSHSEAWPFSADGLRGKARPRLQGSDWGSTQGPRQTTLGDKPSDVRLQGECALPIHTQRMWLARCTGGGLPAKHRLSAHARKEHWQGRPESCVSSIPVHRVQETPAAHLPWAHCTCLSPFPGCAHPRGLSGSSPDRLSLTGPGSVGSSSAQQANAGSSFNTNIWRGNAGAAARLVCASSKTNPSLAAPPRPGTQCSPCPQPAKLSAL